MFLYWSQQEDSASAHIGIIVRSQAHSNSTVWLLPGLGDKHTPFHYTSCIPPPPFEPSCWQKSKVPKLSLRDLRFYGASKRIRTPDLSFTKALLYQLSYAGDFDHFTLISIKSKLETCMKQSF